MQTLYFITGNPHKLREIGDIMPDNFQLKGLGELNIHYDLPETSTFLENNALEKLLPVITQYNVSGFAEDTGLEVEALGGAPGVKSARYAGPDKNSEDNIDKLLDELAGKSNRRARFRTSLCLFLQNRFYHFSGIIRGKISSVRSGSGGFGYDPVFIPEGYDQSFAALDAAVKNKISHRARATQAMLHFLQEL